MSAYYNENDPKAAAWLRELIKAGAIAPGEVDERSIEDVTPNDLRGYEQHHFFAGIGGWSYALRLSGWPDSRPVWTGSCPCQPFSQAGKRAGDADDRHLWPAFFHLIEFARPSIVFGEQVASKDGLRWLDLVSSDLEGAGYAVGAADLCAAGVGAPHKRQRLYWVADHYTAGWRLERRFKLLDGQRPSQWDDIDGCGSNGELGDTGSSRGGWDSRTVPSEKGGSAGSVRSLTDQPQSAGATGILANPNDQGSQGRCERGDGTDQRTAGETSMDGSMAHANGRDTSAEGLQRGGEHGQQPEDGGDIQECSFWNEVDWIYCNDPKGPRLRPVEPGTFPLAHGIPGRVGLLRGYGNAIVPQVAQAFIESYLEAVA